MIDIVIRRVTSATPRTFNPRNCQTSRSCSCRSESDIEPILGGVVINSGPSTAASPPIQASHCSIASASRLENFANSS